MKNCITAASQIKRLTHIGQANILHLPPSLMKPVVVAAIVGLMRVVRRIMLSSSRVSANTQHSHGMTICNI